MVEGTVTQDVAVTVSVIAQVATLLDLVVELDTRSLMSDTAVVCDDRVVSDS